MMMKKIRANSFGSWLMKKKYSRNKKKDWEEERYRLFANMSIVIAVSMAWIYRHEKLLQIQISFADFCVHY